VHARAAAHTAVTGRLCRRRDCRFRQRSWLALGLALGLGLGLGLSLGLGLGRPSLLLWTAHGRGALFLLLRLLQLLFFLCVGLGLVFGGEIHQHAGQCRIAAFGELCNRAALAERACAGRLADRASVRPDFVFVAQKFAEVDPEAVLDA